MKNRVITFTLTMALLLAQFISYAQDTKHRPSVAILHIDAQGFTIDLLGSVLLHLWSIHRLAIGLRIEPFYKLIICTLRALLTATAP